MTPRRVWLVGRGLAAATLVWAATSAFADRPLLLPGPLDVAASWLDLLTSGRLVAETWVSLRRLALAYGAAAVVGVALGLAMGQWRAVDRIASPLVNSVRAVSGIAWIPIAVVWFGVSEWLPVFIIFYGPVFRAALHGAGLSPGPAAPHLRPGNRHAGFTPNACLRAWS
jgi:ABC-type nitrate/sulfonate/bicarbonate transport system permease component